MKTIQSKETFFNMSPTAFSFHIGIDPGSHYSITSCPLTNLFVIAQTKSTKIFVLNRIGKMLRDFKISGKNVGVQEMKFHECRLLAIRGTHSVCIVEDFSESLEITLDKGSPTIMAWSQDGNYLAIGTNQGALVIFDFMTEKKLFLSGIIRFLK